MNSKRPKKGGGFKKIFYLFVMAMLVFNFSIAPVLANGLSSSGSPESSECYGEPEDFSSAITNESDPVPAVNPAFGSSCDLDIALVIDSSDSMSEFLEQEKAAFSGFIDEFFLNTSAEVAVVDFDTDANVLTGFTSDVGVLKSAIDGVAAEYGDFTNWEAALIAAHGLFPGSEKPDLIVFVSDGNPNTYGDAVSQRPESDSLNHAVIAANSIKNDGIRIITLGMGVNVNAEKLKKISSEDAYYSFDFDALTGLVGDLCQIEPVINPGDIVINELMWPGSASSTPDEWIELKNTTAADIDLSGCQLTKNTGQEALIASIPDGGKILAGGYYLISKYDKNSSKINIDPDLVPDNSAFSLSNDKLGIKLYCGDSWNNGGILIDKAGDGGKPFAGDNNKPKKSMERTDIPGDGSLAENWCTARTQVNWDADAEELGTPGAANDCAGGENGDGKVTFCHIPGGNLENAQTITTGNPALIAAHRAHGDEEEACNGGITCTDADDDGFFAEGGDCGLADCDDVAVGINPDAQEVCGDGTDNNCDGQIDAPGCEIPACTDNDGDGYGLNCDLGLDCDDSDPAVNPGTTEICGDGIDNNCDGQINEGCLGVISGVKFIDLNLNGLKDMNEMALAGWQIELYELAVSSVIPIATATTTAEGYVFENLNSGDYAVKEIAQVGWVNTSGNPISKSLTPTSMMAEVNFGNYFSGIGSISGFKFNDLDSNGLWDEALEPALSGWGIELYSYAVSSTAPVLTVSTTPTTTTEFAGYLFDHLPFGDYEVREINQNGWMPTNAVSAQIITLSEAVPQVEFNFGNAQLSACVDNDGDGYDNCNIGDYGDDGKIIDCDDNNPQIFENCGGGQIFGTISGVKFNDLNLNAIWDTPDEASLGGWQIRLFSAADLINPIAVATTTDVAGYSFNNLALGDYAVMEVSQAGWVQTVPTTTDIITLTEANNSFELNFGDAQYSICTDADQDGYDNCSIGDYGDDGKAIDCNDGDLLVNPGTQEICADGIDNNCDGQIDEGGCFIPVCIDNDSDGYGAYCELGLDCDDTDATIHPGAAEIPYDNIDQNCDGTDLTDVDGDGYIDSSVGGGNDCNDNNAGVNPGASEVCGDGIDNNCDGNIDEGCNNGGSGGGGGGGGIPALYIHTERTDGVNTSSILVTWFTNKPATSRVVYGTSPVDPIGPWPDLGYQNSTAEDTNKVLFHSVNITGLMPGTTYYVRPISAASPEVYGMELKAATAGEPSAATPETPPISSITPTPPVNEPGSGEQQSGINEQGGTVGAPAIPTEETPDEGIIGSGEQSAEGEVLGEKVAFNDGEVQAQEDEDNDNEEEKESSCFADWWWLVLLLVLVIAYLAYENYNKKEGKSGEQMKKNE